jgi:DNA-directed RNA polymerase specialized sigma24 family protein
VWEHAYLGGQRIAAASNPTACLLGMANHVIAQWHRRTEQAALGGDDVLAQVASLDQVDDIDTVDRVLAELPASARQVVFLSIDGPHPAEIADVLQLSQAVVARDLQLARRRITRRSTCDDEAVAPVLVIPEADKARSRHDVAIGTLSARRREVLVRHLYRRLSPAAIGHELGIIANGARVALNSAYTQLAERLNIGRPQLIDSDARSLTLASGNVIDTMSWPSNSSLKMDALGDRIESVRGLGLVGEMLRSARTQLRGDLRPNSTRGSRAQGTV